MEQFERILGVASVVVASGIGVMAVVSAIRGTDLSFYEAMRTTNPPQFRKIVFVCRYNAAMCIGLGLLALAAGVGGLLGRGTFSPLECVGSLLVGGGVTWYSVRLCRWGWRTKAI